MTNRTKKPLQHVELNLAGVEQEQTMANLLQLYAHDFSEFHDLEIGPDGRFRYAALPLYWSEPSRHPFLIKMDGKVAGFVLVKRGSELSDDPTVWDIAEFFVLRGCRRRGIGTQVAQLVWRRFPGPWEVRVMQSNVSARHFWTHAISTFTGEAIDPVYKQKAGEEWALYRFESKTQASRSPVNSASSAVQE
jgi:predicted acetyltransferase